MLVWSDLTGGRGPGQLCHFENRRMSSVGRPHETRSVRPRPRDSTSLPRQKPFITQTKSSLACTLEGRRRARHEPGPNEQSRNGRKVTFSWGKSKSCS